MPQTKTFTKKTELVFTTIEIEKKSTMFCKRSYYVAKFKSGESKQDLEDNHVSAVELDTVFEKLKLLLGEIDERHYIIK